jgi:branched-chain amino acid transport system permease protein
MTESNATAGHVAPATSEVSSSYRMQMGTRTAPVIGSVAALVMLALIGLPAIAPRDLLQNLTLLFFLLTLAQCWNLLAGYAGLVSVGQQAFVGIGAYVLFALVALADIEPLLAGVVAAMISLPVGVAAFRLRGPYFAVVTWVIAEIFRLLFAQLKELGGGTGMSLPRSASRIAGMEWVSAAFGVRGPAARDIIIYWAALGLAALVIAGVYLALRSRLGLALAAIKDDEIAAESFGVGSLTAKFGIYVATAFATGLAGALIFLQKSRISPDAAFAVVDWTAYIIFIVVIGGIGTIEGPIIGAILFVLLQNQMADLGPIYLTLLGALAIAVMLIAPKGVWGSTAERFGLQLFPTQRRLVVRTEPTHTSVAEGERHA